MLFLEFYLQSCMGGEAVFGKRYCLIRSLTTSSYKSLILAYLCVPFRILSTVQFCSSKKRCLLGSKISSWMHIEAL